MKLVGVLVLLGLKVLASELLPQSFSCTGKKAGDLCLLSDPGYYATATWHFTNIVPGDWRLILEGIATDPCVDCTSGRDVLVQVFWRSFPLERWNWRFVTLRNESPGAGGAAYLVRGELPLPLIAGELWVLVRRFVVCDPWVSFGPFSARLWRPEPLPVVTPPPPAIPVPPPPPAVRCETGPLWTCQPGLPPQACLPLGVDLGTVARTGLSETMGPEDAATLSFGHYQGSMSEGDWQDWCRFSLAKGEAAVVYFEPQDDLVVDLYLVHDPCGTDLAMCLRVSGPTTIEVPCAEGVECMTIPDGLTECFPRPRCRFFLRIVHRSGAGSYGLSLLPAKPKPL